MEIIVLKEIDSTNNYAKKLIDKNKNNFVVLANKQTNGRGRLDRKWISNEGGLYFSLVKDFSDIYPILTPLAIVKTLKLFNIDAKIKFPNDITINNKKLSGILIESYKDRVIIGIGINFYNKVELDTAISIYDLNTFVDRLEFLFKFLEIFNKYLKKDKNQILDEYKKYSSTLNQKVKLILPNKVVEGFVRDIDFDGITLKIGDREVKYPTGEVVHLRI
ncbi:biotin--[acetyl-CoA-carboxylase] ligase [Methanocaldococcus indicus]|uniref:biotin--[acetyl-CoA-carboxylase] ligase n=1 Tax=Methanocaldococcus indicus TaxID=213231 RepID=UPI003C6DA2F1